MIAAAVSLPLAPLRLGSFRVTPFGACAAAGLFGCMGLGRTTARQLRLDPDQVSDAGLFALLACLVSSRALLVVENPRAFAHNPLLVLGLPSLTLAGLLLAGLAVVLALRRKGLPLLRFLDAYAAPGALLAAFLECGHLLDASETGMPSHLPWAVPDPWTAGSERVHPVAAYGVLLALGVAGVLWRALPRNRAWQGRLAALGLLLGGAAAFSLDMLSLPVPGFVDLGIEPGQWLALAATLAGALLWTFAPPLPAPPLAGPGECPILNTETPHALAKHAAQGQAPPNGEAGLPGAP